MIPEDSENISFFFIDEKEETVSHDIQESDVPTWADLMNLDLVENKDETEDWLSFLYDYTRYTVKELFMIGEYYGMAKKNKWNKCSKEEIIQQLFLYEKDESNREMVFRRKTMWFYLHELKNDKHMKKYILW